MTETDCTTPEQQAVDMLKSFAEHQRANGTPLLRPDWHANLLERLTPLIGRLALLTSEDGRQIIGEIVAVATDALMSGIVLRDALNTLGEELDEANAELAAAFTAARELPGYDKAEFKARVSAHRVAACYKETKERNTH